MNSRYEIIWTNVAENDLINIIEYISVDSPQNRRLSIIIPIFVFFDPFFGLFDKLLEIEERTFDEIYPP